jgi:hypothetical protein
LGRDSVVDDDAGDDDREEGEGGDLVANERDMSAIILFPPLLSRGLATMNAFA